MKMITRRGFVRLSMGGIIASTLGYEIARGAGVAPDASINQRLSGFGKKFRFAIFADPHFAHKENHDPVPNNARAATQKAVAEINAMHPEVAFVVHIGDLGNVPDQPSLDNWLEHVQPLKPLSVMVHGNHDGDAPYPMFTHYEQQMNGSSDLYYSFDCGDWHFVAIPCNLNRRDAATQAVIEGMFAFLEKDLAQNSAKPTIVLQHLHFMPMGLTQTEWYFFDLDLRKRLRDLYTKHGNVRWAFNGHVHNGVEASIKTSWNYQGINFINCPTIIVGRPFGEEFAEMEDGLTKGGYYMIVNVDGDKVSLEGRLAGLAQGHSYPDTFQPFTDEVEPKLFHLVGELPVAPDFVNGDFSGGLKGWTLPYRYMRRENPAYTAEVVPRSDAAGEKALHIVTRESGAFAWGRDECNEATQVLALPAGKNPVVSASYSVPEAPSSGGGYVRAEFLRGTEFLFLSLFHWGVNEENSVFSPMSVGYALTGILQNWRYFRKLANQKKGFFWRLPMTAGPWNDLQADLAGLYDRAMGKPGAFAAAAPDRVRLAIGTWNDRVAGSSSQGLFSRIALKHADSPQASTLNGVALADANIEPVVFGDSMGKEY